MSDNCEECGMPQHNPITCLQNLRLISQMIEKRISAQEESLNYYESNSKSLLKDAETQDFYKDVIHERSSCDYCFQSPLLGTRYKCSICPNFSLCSTCRNTVPHEHGKFYLITTGNFHNDKNCSNCLGRIADVIHKCKHCHKEICHECLVLNEHEHKDIIEIMPFDIIVEAFCNKSTRHWKNGTEVLIKFVIYNRSQQEVNSLIVQEEDCPFNAIKRETKVALKEGEITVMEIGGIINAQTRVYRSKFRFLETSINEIIGPEIHMKFSITEGFFQRIFKNT